MLTAYSATTRAPVAGPPAKPIAADVVWVDLLNANAEEVAAVEAATGLTLPTLASLKEIETSSRMRREGDAIVLSLPLPVAGTDGLTLMPIGFVLGEGLLVTIRFDADLAFEQFSAGLTHGSPAEASPMSILIGIFETIVDRMADRLEEIGDRLDVMAERIFGAKLRAGESRSTPKLKDAELRELMRQVGRVGQTLGKLRASLLTGGRIVPYVDAEGKQALNAGTSGRLGILRADIASLDEYEAHLSNKVQFLLDATLGLINMDQNDSFKVLTIASVVGIPPTLVASMYGMNFHNMPELSWAFGYPYGLAMITLSAAIPLIWFKVKGWF